MDKMTRRVLGVAGFVLMVAGASASFAQQPPTVRIRGQIEKVDGDMLDIKARNGEMLKVKLVDPQRMMAMVKASLADIKPGSYIGVTAMPQADGSQKAIAIHIFLESHAGGTGEGSPAMGSAAGQHHDQRDRGNHGRRRRRPEHHGQVQGRGKEGRRPAQYADRRRTRRAARTSSRPAPMSSSSVRPSRRTAR